MIDLDEDIDGGFLCMFNGNVKGMNKEFLKFDFFGSNGEVCWFYGKMIYCGR